MQQRDAAVLGMGRKAGVPHQSRTLGLTTAVLNIPIQSTMAKKLHLRELPLLSQTPTVADDPDPDEKASTDGDEPKTPLARAFYSQFTWQESLTGQALGPQRGNASYEARQTLLVIASKYEQDQTVCFLAEDGSHGEGFTITIVGKPRRLTTDPKDVGAVGIPCIFRANSRVDMVNMDVGMRKWMILYQKLRAVEGKCGRLVCNVSEQALLLRHLEQNALRVSEGSRLAFQQTQPGLNFEGFSYSFISPMTAPSSPGSPEPTPSPTSDTGRTTRAAPREPSTLCMVCNERPHRKTCSRCKVRKFCGKACQAADWKTHKKHCHPPQGTRIATTARADHAQQLIDVPLPAVPPPLQVSSEGIGQRFLIKAQLSIHGDPLRSPVLLNNRGSALQISVSPTSVANETFLTLVQAIQRLGIPGTVLGLPRIQYGLKAYFYASIVKKWEQTTLRILLHEAVDGIDWK